MCFQLLLKTPWFFSVIQFSPKTRLKNVLKARLTLSAIFAKLAPQMLLLGHQTSHFTKQDPNEQRFSFEFLRKRTSNSPKLQNMFGRSKKQILILECKNQLAHWSTLWKTKQASLLMKLIFSESLKSYSQLSWTTHLEIQTQKITKIMELVKVSQKTVFTKFKSILWARIVLIKSL